jgi:hypothetical protein
MQDLVLRRLVSVSMDQSKTAVYVVLLHSPMMDRNGKGVTTAVTNLDIHDIARSCKTFGVRRYFIVNPEEEQERLVRTILGHWKEEVSKVQHPSRAEALDIVRYLRTFEEAFNEVSVECGGRRPFVVMPDAKDLPDAWSCEELRGKIEARDIEDRPVMIVFGTGWGIAPSFYGQVDRPLRPLRKWDDRGYNHLSVRAAAAIVLDRVLGFRN